MAHFVCKSLLALITWTLMWKPAFSSQELSAHPGDNVTLHCQGPVIQTVTALEWTRSDLEELEYVFLYRDGHIVPDHQHPSFMNRVELRDGEMKNGDLSLTLKNVKKNDSGTYECRIVADGARRRRRGVIRSEPICIINLKVEGRDVKDPDPEGLAGREHVAVAVSVPLAVIAAAAAAALLVFLFVRRRKQKAPGQDFLPVYSVIQT